MTLHEFDARIIRFFHAIHIPFARIALFVVFFWFGILKVLGLSPAGPLVHDLFNQTISFVPFNTFYIAFALLECLIGILFLIKGAERIVIPILFLHIITTITPLFLLPAATWQSFMVPTLEGQYIIKNLLIIAATIVIAANLRPLKQQNQQYPQN